MEDCEQTDSIFWKKYRDGCVKNIKKLCNRVSESTPHNVVFPVTPGWREAIDLEPNHYRSITRSKFIQMSVGELELKLYGANKLSHTFETRKIQYLNESLYRSKKQRENKGCQ